MAGSGFFGSWSPVDTNNPTPGAAPVAEAAPAAQACPECGEPGWTAEGGCEPCSLWDGVADEIVGEPVSEAEVQEALTPAPAPAAPTTAVSLRGPGANIISAARSRSSSDGPYVMCGIAGPPGSGKSGVVLDSLTQQEKESGAEVWHIDFDLGGETTKAAHHTGSSSIVVVNPWVLQASSSRVPYDFPATYQRTLDILRAAAEQAEAQEAFKAKHGHYPSPYLKTICFDGADHWLNICETLMKVEDLDLGPDGIAVAGRKATTQIGRFNWNIRKNRYNSAMTALKELCRRGVHTYIITHLKAEYDANGNEIPGAGSPHWLKDTEGWLQQMVLMEIVEERNERGELTGEANSYGIMTKNRTSLNTGGRVHIFRKDADGGEWFGWPGLRDGSFGVE